MASAVRAKTGSGVSQAKVVVWSPTVSSSWSAWKAHRRPSLTV
jgi:hypothetical protein